MQKKIIPILCILILPVTAKAFLGEDLGSNLYKNIDEGRDNLEQSQYTQAVLGEYQSFTENINKMLKNKGIGECIEENLSLKDIQNISNGDIQTLTQKIKPGTNCKTKEGKITTALTVKILNHIKEFSQISLQKANEKIDKINKISRIGIYSDGNLKNSPFDLVKDLQDIDKIIFASQIPYEGEDIQSILDYIQSRKGKNDFENPIQNSETIKNINKQIERIKNNNTTTPQTNEELKISSNNYICEQDYNTSGLNPEVIAELREDIEGTNNQPSNNSQPTLTSNQDTAASVPPNTPSGEKYKQKYDPWPCTNFFCITIEWITYPQKLLAGGQNITIEYLLNRSNKHLRKFVGTSLIPAKMTTNNFELGLTNIKFSELFHIGFVISKKPIPILDIQTTNNTQKTKEEFSKKNLLAEYYKNLGLNYSRRNDLELYKKSEYETKSMLDSLGLTVQQATQKYNQTQQNQQKAKEKNEVVRKQIEQYANNEELQDFIEQFSELQVFTRSMNDYINSIYTIIKAMDTQIPKG